LEVNVVVDVVFTVIQLELAIHRTCEPEIICESAQFVAYVIKEIYTEIDRDSPWIGAGL